MAYTHYKWQFPSRLPGAITIVGAHAEGEVGDVIVSGIKDVPTTTMYEKMMHFWTEKDHIRQLVLNEPRGKTAMNCNIVLPPCDPRADVGFLIMESDEFVPMSGSNTICTATVLLETGMIPMQEPETKIALDTAAGLVTVTAKCQAGKCKSVSFDNIASFPFELDLPVHVPGIGTIKVDLAWGGMIYALVDVASVGLEITNANAATLVEVGERIKRAVKAQITPVHPENPGIRGVSVVQFTVPPELVGGELVALNTVIVSPGRHDRSPCGTGTCARMAVMHARGELKVGQVFRHRSITGTEFVCRVRGTTAVGGREAVLPTIEGRAWITGLKTIVLDPTDPFPGGYRLGDAWPVVPVSDGEMVVVPRENGRVE